MICNSFGVAFATYYRLYFKLYTCTITVCIRKIRYFRTVKIISREMNFISSLFLIEPLPKNIWKIRPKQIFLSYLIIGKKIIYKL